MNRKFPIAYAVKSTDLTVRKKSRSGGAFTPLSNFVLNQNGVIYGCMMDGNFNIIHSRAATKDERDLFRGSKYVQSNLNDCFSKVKADLLSDKYVMFSGTSCQIAGLLSYLYALKVNMDHLFTVDIVCYGVPSPLVWKYYIESVKLRYGGEIQEYDFRNKLKFGWVSHVETATIAGKKHYINEFTQLFHSHKILRPSCFDCQFKGLERKADITLADFWGIDKVLPMFNDGKGVSLVLINSDKGVSIFNKSKNELNYQEVVLDKCLQPTLLNSVKEPEDRIEFWEDYNNHGIEYVINKYTLPYKKSRQIIFKAFLRNKVPRWLKNIVIFLKNKK